MHCGSPGGGQMYLSPSIAHWLYHANTVQDNRAFKKLLGKSIYTCITNTPP